jgi:multidrug efflux pump
MHAVDQGDTQNLGPFMKQYYQLLTKVLSYPKSFVAIILSSLVLTIILYLLFGRGMEFFPDVEPKSSIISIRSQGNISLRQRDQIAREVEDKILNMNDEIAVFYTRAGIFRGAGNNTDDVIARIQLEYVDWKNRRKVKKIVNEIKDKLKNFPGLIIEIDNKKEGPPQGKPIQIEVSARDKILIDKTILRLEEIMNSIKEITNISNDKSTPEIEWNIEVDRNKAARYGADVNLIGSYIKLATNGVLLTKYRPDYTDEEVEILARFPEEFRNISQLKNVFINTSLGSVAISSFIKIVPQNKIKQINRVNAQRASTLFADVLPDVLPSDVIKKINTLIKKENFEPNIQIKFKGEQEDQEEAKNFLIKAFISALMFMILILLLQFNSYYQVFIIMTAVFLSTTGVFLGLMITQQAFVIVMCGVGIIALAGIVVNNNILLIDAYAEYILDGESKKQAIIKAAISRLRPILLTAGTTVLGLLPMITGINIDFLNVEITYNAPSNQWWRQLSTTIAGGLSFATILTLFFTPALLMIGRNKD